MTLTLELTPEEARIVEQARAQGMDVNALLHDILARLAEQVGTPPLYKTVSLEEWDAALDALGDDIDPALPPLPDKALTRDSFYADRVR
jgi:hypothetical protein